MLCTDSTVREVGDKPDFFFPDQATKAQPKYVCMTMKRHTHTQQYTSKYNLTKKGTGQPSPTVRNALAWQHSRAGTP